MTTLISESDAATRIVSLWKGFRVRKIFSTLDHVKTWSEYDENLSLFDESICKNPAHANFLTAWNAALDKADHRLWKSENGCQCHSCYPSERSWSYEEEDTTDWMWNDGGGYCDW